MSGPNVITLYDIPSHSVKDVAWSPNVWKARHALNIKGLPYKTVWVEFPDIEDVCKKLGAAPTWKKVWQTNPDDNPLYTLPVIHDPSTNAVVSDSLAIVEYLDRTYPSSPRLVPSGTHGLLAALNDAIIHTVVLPALYPYMIQAITECMNPPSAEYYCRTREMMFGKKIDEISPPGPVRDEQWKKVKIGFGVVAGWLTTDQDEAIFVMGDKASFADLIIVELLTMVKKVLGANGKEWDDIQTWDGGRWARLMEAFEPYDVVA